MRKEKKSSNIAMMKCSKKMTKAPVGKYQKEKRILYLSAGVLTVFACVMYLLFGTEETVSFPITKVQENIAETTENTEGNDTGNKEENDTGNKEENDTGNKEVIAENAGTDVVNINTADIDALLTLKGIGKSKAVAIVEYRREHGPFLTVEDIMCVPGIKEATFVRIKERIVVE